MKPYFNAKGFDRKGTMEWLSKNYRFSIFAIYPYLVIFKMQISSARNCFRIIKHIYIIMQSFLDYFNNTGVKNCSECSQRHWIVTSQMRCAQCTWQFQQVWNWRPAVRKQQKLTFRSLWTTPLVWQWLTLSKICWIQCEASASL